MRQPHHSARDSAEPRILPLQAAAGVAVRDLLDAAVAGAVLRVPAAGTVAISIDVPSGTRVTSELRGFRGLVDRIVTAALVAASAPRPRGDGPVLCEVVITAVDAGDALELEIADSGPTGTADHRCSQILHDLAARCGCTVHAVACPEGGTAVTLRFPRRDARRQAA